MPVLLGAVPSPLRRFVPGARRDDAVRLAVELVADGRLVALEPGPLPGRADAALQQLSHLVGALRAAGLATASELTVRVDQLGPAGAREIADAGIPVVLAGPPAEVDPLVAELPGAGVVVAAGELDAEARCRSLAARHVRLRSGRGADADLAFVRCLNVLMAAGGRPAVATADLRLVAIAGERAAWNGRSPDSWEHVMPYRVRTTEQRRLAAAGLTVRVEVPVRSTGGRS